MCAYVCMCVNACEKRDRGRDKEREENTVNW